MGITHRGINMKLVYLLVISLLLTACGGGGGSNVQPDTRSDVTISSGDIIIGASRDHAMAVTSIKVRGHEYIDNGYRHTLNGYPGKDRGRDSQSAMSCNGQGEAWNPTEAGSSSVHNVVSQSLGHVINSDGSLSTSTKMAFWNPVNGQTISNTVHHKRVAIGHNGIPNLIKWSIQFDIEAGCNNAVNEALTAYVLPEFTKFLEITSGGSLSVINVVPDTYIERNKPVIVATQDDRHAIGFKSPQLPQSSHPGIGYGSFLLDNSTAPKINAVFRETMSGQPQTFHYVVYVAVGTVSEVRDALNRI